jgi:hypothetical protein
MTRLGKKLLILPALAGLCVAADKDATPFRPKPAAEYPNSTRQEGLRVAADPYTTVEQTKPAFGKLNPNVHGVVPILLVMQNEGKNVIKLDTLKVEYVDSHKNRLMSIPAQELPYLKPPERPTVKATPIPPIFQRKKKNELTAIELDQRSWGAKMLPPGESANGFFYFQAIHEPGAMLYITGIRNAATGQELFYFEVPLDPRDR